MGNSVTNAVLSFIHDGYLMKELNKSIILVPKVSIPETVKYFRPIKSCNMVYKIISKVRVNRIKNLSWILLSHIPKCYH